jgi:hypothetical protein
MRTLCSRLGVLLVLCALVTACDNKPSTPASGGGNRPAAAGTEAGTGGGAGAVAPAGGGNAPKALGPM